MKVQELRVGNYLIDEYRKIFQVKQIGTGLIESCGMYIYEIEEVQPIPLTEEILLKCKSVLKQDSKIFTSKYTLPLKRNKCLVITDIGTPNFMIGIAEIDFENKCKVEDLVNIWNWDYEKNIMLHQLQNLYYALCNQELNIQL